MIDRYELINLENDARYKLPREAHFVIGRSRSADLPLNDQACSRRQFRFLERNGKLVIEQLSESVTTYCNSKRLRTPQEVRDGMSIRAGNSSFQVRRVHAPKLSSDGAPSRARESSVDILPVAAGRPYAQTLLGELPDSGMTVGAGVPTRTKLKGEGDTILGRDEDIDVTLPHIQVSRHHARIRQTGSTAIIQDLGSANATFVDGRRLVMPEVLRAGSRIGIGPYELAYTGTSLVPTSRTNNLQLEGRQLCRFVPSKEATDDSMTILDDVTLVIRPHEFVCLLGPSGSGKTTLLSALSARTPANRGHVLINQHELYGNFESLKRDIAVVPQHDILHERLTVEEALRYTARLRLPTDASAEEIESQITQLLERVGLREQRATLISELSGGQRRRASLANELVSNPSLLFLDEVTSGLDEQTDREMMQLFRGVADSGKTVVCVTHTLSNIDETCHLIVLLTVGGKLAFVGTPQEALDYFRIDRLGDVYSKLERREMADHWQQRFLESSYYQRYVSSRLSPASPSTDEENQLDGIRYWQHHAATLRHQLPILLARYFRVFMSDRRALAGLALQCLVVATVLYLVFASELDDAGSDFRRATLSCQVLFVLAVSCFWFGCNNSAKEIVKERAIYTKEFQVNLDPGSYYLSKYLLQVIVACLQSLTLLALVAVSCGLPGNLASQAAILIIASGAGVAVGLGLSSLSTTEEMSLALVPLVLIPQIILSDVFVQLTGGSRFLGGIFATNYWVYGVLRGTLPPELLEQLNSPLAPPLLMPTGLSAIGLHIATLVTGSIFILHVRDRVMSCSNKTFVEAAKETSILRLVLRVFAS